MRYSLCVTGDYRVAGEIRQILKELLYKVLSNTCRVNDEN